MRFIKVIGLAAIAAVAAMAFIGASSASAADNVVLCKKLILTLELCGAGELLPSGAVLRGLASDPVLKNSIATVLCEDATFEAKTTAEKGATLPIEITSL